MDRKDILASVLVDEALAAAMMPWACPCDFGPAGRYRLQELVGVGRGSLIYRAIDRHMSSEGFGANVAVKIMRPGTLDTEALTARRVVHANVLRVFDRGIDDVSNCPYLVMEFVEGGDLSQKSVPWSTKEAVAFMIKVAWGVHAIHSAGVVHCDLKPSNILLTSDGQPKVGDFDLSRSVLDASTEARGNLAFMSPEQFAQEENALSPPSDVYALGGLLYHLITGALPNGETHGAVAESHAHQGAQSRVPIKGDLGKIVARAIAHHRADRYNSAGEFAIDLERWIKLEPIDWTRPSPVKRARLWTIRRPVHALAAAMVVLAVGAAIWVNIYNRLESIAREEKAQAETKRLFDEQLAATRQDLISLVRMTNVGNMSKASNDRLDRLLPMLVWLEWFGGTPVLGPQGKLALAEDRVLMLRDELDNLKEAGRGEHMDACLTRYALVNFLIGQNTPAEALDLIAELEQILVPRLVEGDPIRESLSAMKACALALGRDASFATTDIQELKRVKKDLDSRHYADATARLVDRVTKVLETRVASKP